MLGYSISNRFYEVAVAEYALGQEIRWRDHTQSKRWRVGFVVGSRGPWLVVRLPAGHELEIHPANIKEI
jgi:hypothetical protein